MTFQRAPLDLKSYKQQVLPSIIYEILPSDLVDIIFEYAFPSLWVNLQQSMLRSLSTSRLTIPCCVFGWIETFLLGLLLVGHPLMSTPLLQRIIVAYGLCTSIHFTCCLIVFQKCKWYLEHQSSDEPCVLLEMEESDEELFHCYSFIPFQQWINLKHLEFCNPYFGNRSFMTLTVKYWMPSLCSVAAFGLTEHPSLITFTLTMVLMVTLVFVYLFHTRCFIHAVCANCLRTLPFLIYVPISLICVFILLTDSTPLYSARNYFWIVDVITPIVHALYSMGCFVCVSCAYQKIYWDHCHQFKFYFWHWMVLALTFLYLAVTIPSWNIKALSQFIFACLAIAAYLSIQMVQHFIATNQSQLEYVADWCSDHCEDWFTRELQSLFWPKQFRVGGTH